MEHMDSKHTTSGDVRIVASGVARCHVFVRASDGRLGLMVPAADTVITHAGHADDGVVQVTLTTSPLSMSRVMAWLRRVLCCRPTPPQYRTLYLPYASSCRAVVAARGSHVFVTLNALTADSVVLEAYAESSVDVVKADTNATPPPGGHGTDVQPCPRHTHVTASAHGPRARICLGDVRANERHEFPLD